MRKSLRELKEDSLQDRIIIERMGVTMAALMKMVRSLKDAEDLRAKANNLQQESKGTETEDVAAFKGTENDDTVESKGMETEDIADNQEPSITNI